MIDDPFHVLNLPATATKKEVRARYKALAIANHPDKLHGLSDTERAEKEEYFKQVTVAYNMIMEGNVATNGPDYWKDIWERVSNKNIWETFVSVAQKYIRRKKHKVQVPVTLEEIKTAKQKRIQLFLKGVTEPFIIYIDCSEYPNILYEYEADDGSYHNVDIMIVPKEHEVYDIDEEGNLYVRVAVTWGEYIDGTVKPIEYLDGSDIDIVIPAFHHLDERIVIPCKGIRACNDLFIDVEIAGCVRDKWMSISAPERSDIRGAIEKIC
jgi:hypothetical protein